MLRLYNVMANFVIITECAYTVNLPSQLYYRKVFRQFHPFLFCLWDSLAANSFRVFLILSYHIFLWRHYSPGREQLSEKSRALLPFVKSSYHGDAIGEDCQELTVSRAGLCSVRVALNLIFGWQHFTIFNVRWVFIFGRSVMWKSNTVRLIEVSTSSQSVLDSRVYCVFC